MKRNLFLVWLVVFIFGVISFSTNIIGPIADDIKSSFSLSSTGESFLGAAFFMAYLFSIPAAILVNRLKEKTTMIIAFIFSGAAAFTYFFFPTYELVLIVFFMIGLGMAILQVVINPLLRAAGGEEKFAFYSVLAQIAFSGAGYLIPYIKAPVLASAGDASSFFYTASIVDEAGVTKDMSWVALYALIGTILMALGLIIFFIKFPKVELKDDEKVEGVSVYKELLKQRKTWMYFFAIFAYVGFEQAMNLKIEWFLKFYHGYSAADAESAVSLFWLLLLVGCLLGLIVLKLFDSKKILRVFTLATLVLLSFAMFGGPKVSYYCFIATGFTISIMWSVNFSLGMNSFSKYPGAVAGILCTGIIGGALTQPIIGFVTDTVNGGEKEELVVSKDVIVLQEKLKNTSLSLEEAKKLSDELKDVKANERSVPVKEGLKGTKVGLSYTYVLLGYILFISFAARPLVPNEVVKLKDIFKKQ